MPRAAPVDPRAELNPFEAAERQRKVLLRVVRAAFIILLVTVTLLNILKVGTEGAQSVMELGLGWGLKTAIAAVLAFVVIAVDVFTPRKKISTISTIFLGLLAGILATVALGFVVDLVAQANDIVDKSLMMVVKVLLGVCLSYLGISIVLQTQDDFRLVIPYVEFVKQIRGPRPLLLDTSALIDGRIVELGATGLIQSPVVIPRFVVAELQLLADNSDKLKRSRGRRGLEMVGRLQRASRMDVSIEPANVIGQGVDQMIVELARQMQGMVVTTDTGLAKVAQIHGVSVLNLNDLSAAVRPAALPGDQVPVRIVRPGEQPGQGVGYLEDGTMIVVEDGGPSLEQMVTVVIVSTVQTSGGRLLFARLAPNGTSPAVGTAAPVPIEARAGEPGSQRVSAAAPSIEQADAPPTSATGAPEDGATPERSPGPFPPHPPRHPNRLRNPRR